MKRLLPRFLRPGKACACRSGPAGYGAGSTDANILAKCENWGKGDGEFYKHCIYRYLEGKFAARKLTRVRYSIHSLGVDGELAFLL